ncbi:AAR153Cp [Eremothecium gossypii ATCC 10895]|uniref:Acyl-CoA desaturase n=1 Tax=Eremothecium gossypii (strain ATCC 10895 / CBS 109.51 / FGSC 9923 / NRRL Y-1056) TaxID=284811 RepID=Q75EC1_EREGS|nr:AAR153Cp [Eremothecium gossypii ATCC 10895]AAS50520.1 AAR153Cp [Eremothecium gossypii ATCC 10895]AEY94807.1 FAAR153Cp [Eremothecium gossypii FDAG1]
MEQVDLPNANKIAAGANKASVRVVNGLGALMGSKAMAAVDFEKDSMAEMLARDQREKEHYRHHKHISEQPWTLNNWHLHVNWVNIVLVVVVPIIGLYLALSGRVPPRFEVLALAIVYYSLGGLGITAGYHRLWAHRSYSARWPLRVMYALFGASSVEGSIKWWGHSHRIHHRYTDTPRDPYDARRGLWYSHMGWMLLQPNPRYRARADIEDLMNDWVVRLQHRHYVLIMAFMAFLLPAIICHFIFRDFWGGLVYAGILRVFAIQQATFCINSLAHYLGDQPFDDRRTPRDNWITALVTLGEGYHNFHHEFPTDYRNAIRWYQYDPTKVFIYCASLVGLAYDLKKFSQNAIQQGLIQQKQKKLDNARSRLNWGTPLSQLPVWDRSEFVRASRENSGLVVISGIVHDVSGYITEHPGGETLIQAALGKDATRAFNGGVYMHSNAAHNILATMRVAVVKEGQDAATRFAARRGEALEKKTA